MLTVPDTQSLLYDKNRHIGNKFCLITLVRKRAESLVDGSPPLVDVASPNPVSVALFEIEAGKVQRRVVTAETETAVVSDRDAQAAALAAVLGY